MISPEAQTYLDAANALFPGRYRLSLDEWNRWVMFDGHKAKSVGIDPNPISAARKGLHSARLSANNGNRRHAQAPIGRTIYLPAEVWAALERELQMGDDETISDVIRRRLT